MCMFVPVPIVSLSHTSMGFPGGAVVKNLPANAGEHKRHWFDP